VSAGRTRRRRARGWAALPDDELLDLRLCDLGLSIEGSPLEAHVARLHADLARAGLRFRPHVWLSTDWFSPDGVPGVAIPFYLAHPRLARLERRQMLQVEGGDAHWCLQLLRHETGHAIDSAYRLHRRARWRELFGRAARPYRATYAPNPESRRFVLHLRNYYAQSHPSEDFAETFAVWLTPRSRWHERYAGWPALRKLEYVDALMREVSGRPAPVRSRERTDSLATLRMTLRQYYDRKRGHYGREDFSVYDRALGRLFSGDPLHARRKPAATFLRERRVELGRLVTRWTGQHRFAVDDVIGGMIVRCRELGLRLARPESLTAQGAAVLVTMHSTRIQHMRHLEYFR
jgi:hypothetical protein